MWFLLCPVPQNQNMSNRGSRSPRDRHRDLTRQLEFPGHRDLTGHWYCLGIVIWPDTRSCLDIMVSLDYLSFSNLVNCLDFWSTQCFLVALWTVFLWLSNAVRIILDYAIRGRFWVILRMMRREIQLHMWEGRSLHFPQNTEHHRQYKNWLMEVGIRRDYRTH